MSSPKVWFITGASSGFGRATTEAALRDGERVVATLRKPEALDDLKSKYSSKQLLVVKLDVTDPEEIEAAFSEAKQTFGRIDVVFNNAGLLKAGEVEGFPDKEARVQFEILFFGAANVSKTAVKYFRENNPIGGRLLQNSSFFGVLGGPGCGYYSAAKAALEALTESLSQEIDPAWNIKITLIEPGAFKTKGTDINENLVILPPHPAYTNESLPSNQFRRGIAAVAKEGDAPDKAVEAFLKIAALDDPPFRFPIHKISIQALRQKAKELKDAADKWESWSEDVHHSTPCQ